MKKTRKILKIIICISCTIIVFISYAVLIIEIKNKEAAISELSENNIRLTSQIQRMQTEFDKKIEKFEKENKELKESSEEIDAESFEKGSNTALVNSETTLIEAIEEQEVRVISTKYIIQSAQYKSLYPDVLQAVIINETSYDIKNAIVAFVAWDKNNLPVKIKGSIDFSDGAYIRFVNYADINLVPQDSYGDKSGYSIDESCGIVTFKAIVVSYETFEGKKWENPLFDDWCKLYEGVKLTNVPE